MKRLLSALLIAAVVFAGIPFSVEAAAPCDKHVGKIVVTKATTKTAGSVKQVCKDCKTVLVSSPLPKVTEVFLENDVYVYNGKKKTPQVYVFDQSGLSLKKGKDYTVTYPTNRKNCGKYKVVIKFCGNYTGKKTLTFSILPGETAFTSVTATGKSSLSLKWGKVEKGASGYQIQYSTSSKFKKSATTAKRIKTYKTTATTLKNLKKGKTYYVRIRTYNTTKKKTTYSAWSAPSKVNPSKYGYTVKQLLNSEKLTPQKTNYKALDTLVGKLFKKIHTSKMSTYQKVTACYDYLVNNMTYEPSFMFPENTNYVSNYDAYIVHCAYQALSTKTGVCDDYSSAFVVMCRRLGLEAYVVGGTVSKKGGGRTGHAWTYILLNGTKYIFDPQVQSNNKGAKYYFFGKTYTQMGSTYEPDPTSYNDAEFRHFQQYSGKIYKENISCDITITGNNGSVCADAAQNGCTMISNISALFDVPIKGYGNHFVDLTICPKRGSGKYEIALLKGNTTTVLYDVVCSKAITLHIDLSRLKGKTNTLDLRIYDYNNDYSSYLGFTGIRVKR